MKPVYLAQYGCGKGNRWRNSKGKNPRVGINGGGMGGGGREGQREGCRVAGGVR